MSKVTVVEIEHDVPRTDLLTEDTIDPRVESAWSRSSTATFRGRDGLIQTAPADTPRKQFNADGTFDKYLIEPAATNLLLNSDAPATQSVTISDATEYTLSVEGSGSAEITAGGSGTATQGSPLTFTTTATSVTVTVTGSLDYFQLELGSAATSFIITAGSSATRAADDVVIDGADFDALGIKDGGAVVCEAITNGGQIRARTLALYNNINADRQDFFVSPDDTLAAFNSEGSDGSTDDPVTANEPYRFAVGWDSTDAYWSVKAPSISHTETFGSEALMSPPNQLYIGSSTTSGAGNKYLNGGIRALIIYPNRLTNAELETRSVVGWSNTVTRIGEQSLASDILPRLIRSPEYSVEAGLWIWDTRTRSGVGNIEAINVDGGLDFLLDQDTRDKPVRIKTGTSDSSLSTVANLKTDFIRANSRRNLDIAFAPLDIDLRGNFQTKFYDDTAPNPQLENQPYPVSLGAPTQVPAVLYDPATPTYHISDLTFINTQELIDNVSSSGNEATPTTQWTYTDFGFDMSITPAGKVTATIDRTSSEFEWRNIVQEVLSDNIPDVTRPGRGKYPNINQAELQALDDAFNSTIVGMYLTRRTDTRSVVQSLFDPWLAWFFIDPSGEMRFGRLQDPADISGDPVLSITPEQILEASAVEVEDDMMPGLVDALEGRKNEAPIDEDSSAGTLTLQEKADVAAEFRLTESGKATEIAPFYRWAHNQGSLETIIQNTGDRSGAEFGLLNARNNLIAIAGKRRKFYKMKAIIPDPPELLPGQKINVTWPDLGLENGKDLTLIGFKRRLTELVVELEGWA